MDLAVVERIDQVLSEPEERKALHENIYFGFFLKEQWNFLGSSPNKSHNLFSGIPKLGDDILFYQQTAVEPRPFIWKRSGIIMYPPKCATELKKAVISGIAIIDSKNDGTGGEGTIVDGGIGSNYVKIKLSSQWFKGYAFTIIIIGKYIDDCDIKIKSFENKNSSNSASVNKVKPFTVE